MTCSPRLSCLFVALIVLCAPVFSAHAVDALNPPAFGTAGNLISRISPGVPSASIDPDVGAFLPNVRVDDDINPEHREPAVAWGPGGDIYCIYVERATHYNPEFVMFTRSLDGGATWLAPAIRVSDTVPNATFMPAIGVMSDGTITAVWGEMKFGPNYNDEIRFSRSEDGGMTWSPSLVVHPIQPTVEFLRPSLLVVGPRILVSYWTGVGYPNGRPTVVWSDDRGVTWSAPVTVGGLVGPYDGAAPCLAYNAERGTVGLVMPTSDEKVYFYTSANLGQTWSAGVQVNDTPAISVDYPDLVCYQGSDYIVWYDNRNEQYDCDIWFSRSADGVHFSPNVKVNDSLTGNQYEPHIVIDAVGRVHVCWIWNIPFQMNIDLYYSVSSDGGTTWLTPCPRVNDVPYVVQPYCAWTSDLLADASGNAYAFWNDGRSTHYYDNVYSSRALDPAAVSDDVGRRVVAGGFFGLWQITGQPGPEPVLRLRLDRPVDGLRLEWIDAQGRRLGEVAGGALLAGDHQLGLCALAGGRAMRPGTYFLRLTGGGKAATQRIVVVK